MPTYNRPSVKKLEPQDASPKRRRDAIHKYLAQAEAIAKDPARRFNLNSKMPREVVEATLSHVGGFLQEEVHRLQEEGILKETLSRMPVPEGISGLLTDELRIFCLLLNALKQWVSSESAAMDRLLFPGNVRKQIKEWGAGRPCPIFPGTVMGEDLQLHHPARDGRPPIPLSPDGHAEIEDDSYIYGGDPEMTKLVAKRKEYKVSWYVIANTCIWKMGFRSRPSKDAARAEKVIAASGMNPLAILKKLDEHSVIDLEDFEPEILGQGGSCLP